MKAAIAFAAFIICIVIVHTFSTELVSKPPINTTVAANTANMATNYYEIHRYYYKHNRPYYGHRKHYIASRQDSAKKGIIHY